MRIRRRSSASWRPWYLSLWVSGTGAAAGDSFSLQVEEGLSLLLEVLQDLAAQKVTKFWYLLRAHVLQLVAVYLSLPPARLSPRLRQRIFAHGEFSGDV